jgi:hypothetical protein
MDVTFHESKPFYGDTSDLADLFQVLDQLHLLMLKRGREQKMGTLSKMASNNNKFPLLRRSLQFLIGLFLKSMLRDLHYHKDGSKILLFTPGERC